MIIISDRCCRQFYDSTAMWIMPPPLNGPLKGPIFVKIWSSPPWLLNLQVSCKSSFHLFSWRSPSLWRGSSFFPRLWKIPREPICRRSLFFPLARGIFQSTTLVRYTTSICGEIYIVPAAKLRSAQICINKYFIQQNLKLFTSYWKDLRKEPCHIKTQMLFMPYCQGQLQVERATGSPSSTALLF